jgi:hypothetical protein
VQKSVPATVAQTSLPSQAKQQPMTKLPKEVLTTATLVMLGGDPADMTLNHLIHLITVTQHATNLLLNEIERRDELTFHEGAAIVPYISEHVLKTVLTRGG